MVANKVSMDVVADTTGAISKIKGVGNEFKALEGKAKVESGKIATHFDGVGDKLVRRFQRKDIKTLGNSISNSILMLATGGSVADVVAAAGLAMGVSMATQFVVTFAERIAGSAAVQAIIPVVAALGTTIGTVLSTAAAVAMAIWPALLVAAIVAGIVFLINNPEVVAAIQRFAKDMHDRLMRGLAIIGESLKALWVQAMAGVKVVVDRTVGPIVNSVMQIVNAVAEALRMLRILEGTPKNIYKPPNTNIPHYASGGWAGLRGPELAILGEKGPEYVHPNRGRQGSLSFPGGNAGHGHDIIMDGRVVGGLIDERNDRKARMTPARLRA